MNHVISHDDAALNGSLRPVIWGDGPNVLPSVPDKTPPMAPVKNTRGLSVALIDDRLLIREGFARCLEAAHERISAVCFSTTAEWEAAADQHPEISLVLLCRSGRKMAESHDEIRALSARRSPVVLVSDEGNTDEIRAMIALGVRGFIPERVELPLAIAAMYLVRAGGVYLPEVILNAPQCPPSEGLSIPSSPLQGLFTERQAAVVEALRQGKPNKIIAFELNMRESTVKVHIRNVMTKLKAKNRTEVAFITNTLCHGESN